MRRLAGFLAVTLAVAVAGLPAGSGPAVAYDLESELAEVAEDINAVKSAIDDAQSEGTEVADTILETDARLTGLVGDLNRTEADLGALQGQVTTRRDSLDETREDLKDQYRALEVTRFDLQSTREDARTRALQIYMGGGRDSLGTVLFTAEEITTLGVGLEYASQIADSTDKLVNRLETLEALSLRQAELIGGREQALEDDVIALEGQQSQLEELAASVTAQRDEVHRELDAQRAALREVRAEIEHFERELDGLEAEQGRIRQLILAEQSQGTEAPSGVFVRPVPGAVTSTFGYRTHPILGTRRLHTGIDMRGGSGTPIRAAASGRVILAAYYGGYGNAVIIDHGGGVTTLYAHQSRLAVSKGSQVGAGETIGYVGSTGLSTGPHLHFEVRENGTPVNPLSYL